MTFIDGKTQASLDRFISTFTVDEQADLRSNGTQSEHYTRLVDANSGDAFWANAVVAQLQAQT